MPLRCRLTLPPLYPAGGVLSLSPADFAFSLIFCPHPPYPLPGGKGETLRLFYARGFAPCIPATEPARHWFDLPIRHPAGAPSESPTRRKSDRTAFLLAVPAAKERGDRGRGTSAFEMVLSPGAGRTSAAGVHFPLRAPQRQGQPATNRDKPPSKPTATYNIPPIP